MRRRAALLVAMASMVVGLVGSADAVQPGPISLPAVQLTVSDACTGSPISGASVSISDPAGTSVSPSIARGSSFAFDRLDLSDAELHVSASGHQPLGDAAAPDPGVWLYRSTDDFALWPAPASGTVVAGGGLSATVLTQTVQGSAQPVALSVSGAPAGVTATVAPSLLPSPGASALSIATVPAAVPGVYPLTVTGAAASGTHSAVFMLTVAKVPKPTADDFALGLSPAGGSVIAGTTAITGVSTVTTHGSAQPVAMSASGLPAGVSASFDPPSIVSGESAKLTFAASAVAPTGLAKITVTATAASGTRSLVYGLFVAGGAEKAPATKRALAFSSPDAAAAARPIVPLSLTDGSSVGEGLSAAVMLTPVTGCAASRVPKVAALTVNVKTTTPGVVLPQTHVLITSDLSAPDSGVGSVQSSGTMAHGSGGGEGKASFNDIDFSRPTADVALLTPGFESAHVKVGLRGDRPVTPPSGGAIAVGVVLDVALAQLGQNLPPVVDWIAADATSTSSGAPITLSATAHDPEAEPITTSWTATPACSISDPTNPDTTVTCANPGSTTVTLRVTDPHGASGSRTISLWYIAAAPPDTIPFPIIP